MNIECIEQPETVKKLTDEILKELDFSKVIYGDQSRTGAMGFAGHVLLYVFDCKMTPYLVTFYDDEVGYNLAREYVAKNIEFFDHYGGGMGNSVLFKKDSPITIDREKECLIYEKDGKKYRINCSVLGVFNTISNKMIRVRNN